MEPRERYMAVLEGGRPDMLPRMPILMQFAAEHIGSYYGAFASDHRVLVEANLRCAEEFGIDQLSAISDPYRETAGFGAPIEFPRNGVPICLKPPLEEDPDLARLSRPDPLKAPRMRDRVDAVSAYKARAGGRYSIMGWVEGPAAEAADLRGVSNFFVDLLDDPAYASALMARCVDTAIDFARAQVAAGADTVGIGDAVAPARPPMALERRDRRLRLGDSVADRAQKNFGCDAGRGRVALEIGPETDPGAGEPRPVEQFAGILFALGGNIGMADDMPHRDRMPGEDRAGQFLERPHLRVGKGAIAPFMARIDQFDADGDPVQVALALPEGDAGVPGAPLLGHQGEGAAIFFDQVVGGDLGLRVAQSRERLIACRHAGIVQQHHVGRRGAGVEIR